MNEWVQKSSGRQLVMKVVNDMAAKDDYIDSAQSISKVLAQEHQLEWRLAKIRDVMKKDLGMRFRKIAAISQTANSDRNLVLRQQFAIKFIEAMERKRVIINIDETWLGMMDFRRRKWKVPTTTNSVPKKQLAPRVSMILGLDTIGNVYMALVQANSNAKIMEIFFQSLVRRLDSERPLWRKDTVILLDNASYHVSSTSIKMFKRLQIPIIWTGPHSYDAAPAELMFAAFKADDINPRKVKTGKQ
jgi:uncharacterized protein (UPF0216 family)